MTDFWRLVFPSIIWSLATLCDTLITIRENHWLLRLIWRFSESVFRMWICVSNVCLNNNSLFNQIYFSTDLSKIGKWISQLAFRKLDKILIPILKFTLFPSAYDSLSRWIFINVCFLMFLMFHSSFNLKFFSFLTFSIVPYFNLTLKKKKTTYFKLKIVSS